MSGWAIQQAIFSTLSSDDALIALCDTISDFGPRQDDASGIYPYIAFGDLILSEDDTDTTRGFDMSLRIHTYSDAGGTKECRQIQDAMYDLLHLSNLIVTGYNTVIIYREDSQILQTSRGAFHGIDEYRCLLERT